MDPSLIAAFKTVFVVVAALLPILNPPGSAPVFLAMTQGASPEVRAVLARRIAFNVFFMLVAAMFVGSFVLEFFGISLPVVRVAGGLLVCSTAWHLLTAADPQDTGDAAISANSVSSSALVGLTLLSATVFVFLRFAERILRPLGKTGTTVFLRLMAFVLLCIGVEIPWDGLSALLEPWKAVRR